MDDYLTKPVRVDALRKTLARLLGGAQMDSDRGSDPPAVTSMAAPGMNDTLPELDDTRRSPKVIQLVLKHVPDQLAALAEAIESKDVASCRAQAHKLKGSTASIGARRMAATAEDVQKAAEAGDLSQAPQAMETLKSSFAYVKRHLERDLNNVLSGSGAPAPP
jgi:HPt (histidine-containing phosphotransfer) domain-containing protein